MSSKSVDQRPLTELFVAIADYALRNGIRSISSLPGCWESQVDDQWWVAVNGHNDERLTSEGESVPSFSAYVKFNGWPAGVVTPYDGAFAAGAAANEDAFRAALAATTTEGQR